MSVKENLLGRLKTEEGLKLMPYKDTVGKLTIGYGRCIQDIGISQEEADYMLNNDIDRVLIDCQTLTFYNKLSNNRKIAIADLVFNMGMKTFLTFKNMIRAIQDERWNDAYNELLSSKYAAQVNGRAFQLANMLKDG